ncbi:septal ring lytic transglycosylase RlpA family protein [Allosphingosinicella sp.]|uniref:septal ring lytic transglycosylase RlpA family protein n=1 Tax=Allosphingosinicella sp. TaxID=2823234 RepID=UPI002FC129B4
MSITKAGRRRGHTVVAVALAGLMSSVPVKADTPHGLPEIEAATATPVDPTATPVAEPELAPIVEEAGPEYQHLADGEASYYGAELAGNRTASGEIFDPRQLTAAHRTLPMGTKLRVTNKSNGKSVIVRINDRGPFVKKRIVDISRAAAEKISMVRAGRALVSLDLLR